MPFLERAMISLLAGIGTSAGTVGFATGWIVLNCYLLIDPWLGDDAWFLSSIFLPGTPVPLIVFHYLCKPWDDDAEYTVE